MAILKPRLNNTKTLRGTFFYIVCFPKWRAVYKRIRVTFRHFRSNWPWTLTLAYGRVAADIRESTSAWVDVWTASNNFLSTSSSFPREATLHSRWLNINSYLKIVVNLPLQAAVTDESASSYVGRRETGAFGSIITMGRARCIYGEQRYRGESENFLNFLSTTWRVPVMMAPGIYTDLQSFLARMGKKFPFLWFHAM